MSNTHSTALDHIVESGNRSLTPPWSAGNNIIRCKDGFRVSVIAGEGTYCTPRPDSFYREGAGAFNLGDVPGDYSGPFTHVEVGFPSERPEPWGEWEQYADGGADTPTETVYGYVPVELVRALIEAHGGETS